MAWPPTFLGDIPENQQTALPLYKLGDAGKSGYFTCFGGKLFRYWKHAELAFPLPQVNVPFFGGIGTYSAVLDLRGMQNLNLVGKRVVGGAMVASDIRAYVWPQFSDGAVSLYTADVQASLVLMNDHCLPTAGAGTYIYNFCCSASQTSGGANYTTSFGVGFARLVVHGFGTNLDPTWTWELWGQG